MQIIKEIDNQLQDLAKTEETGQASPQQTAATRSENSQLYPQKFGTRLKTSLPNLAKILIGAFQQFRRNYFRLREMTGLTPDKAAAEKNLSRFLTDTEKHISALPEIYQNLFRLEPLNDERFFTARAEEITLLEKEFERWQNGKFTATVLIGERGCGITTLLNFAEKQIYKDYPVIKIDFLDGETIFSNEALFKALKTALKEAGLKRDIKNMNDLEKAVNELKAQKIVIVENLQQLFLRTTYGFDAVERFMLFISRTHQKIHWVMTCAIYSWEYLAKVINIDEYVQRKIVLDALSQAEFENIILKRHQASGLQLIFKATDEIANSRRFKKLKSNQARQAYLQSLFFKRLTELAVGNITVAMLLWLRSYDEFSKDKLILPTTIDFDPTFLYQLPAEELFTLAALLQHDTLTDEHHALIFHQDIQQSLLLLNRMANKGYLVQRSNGYQIHPFLYCPIVRVLKSENIIH